MLAATFNLLRKLPLFGVMALIVLSAMPSFAGASTVLKGGVQEENLRLAPSTRAPMQGRADDGLRISRSPLRGSAVDAGAFAGTAESPNSSPLAGAVNDFAKAPKNFDIGAERGSKEMVLAWERWHRQLSGAIYERWQRVAQDAGRATLRVTVTKDHRIFAQVVRCDGGPAFEDQIMSAISSLNGNPGLTFPAKSERNQVSFEADYIAASNIRPGYSWVKNDYEKVRENY